MKENGFIMRAGIIYALMKSISPCAFILGTMIGIFTEAILIELFILMLGKNLIGFMIGGAVRKSLLQKISRRWNIGNACIFDITESSILEVENKLYEIILNSIPSQ